MAASGALVIPSGATVQIVTSAQTNTLSFNGITYYGKSVMTPGGAVSAFSFTDINVGSNVKFQVSAPSDGSNGFLSSQPLAIVGTGNANISSGISVSAVSSQISIAGGGRGGAGVYGVGGQGGSGGGGGAGGQGNTVASTSGGGGNSGTSSPTPASSPGGLGFGQIASGSAGTAGNPGFQGFGAFPPLNAGSYPGGNGGAGGPGFQVSSGTNGGNGGNAPTNANAAQAVLIAGSGGGAGGAGGGGGGGSGGGGGGGNVFTYSPDPNHTVSQPVTGGDGGAGGAGGNGGDGGIGGDGGAGGGALYIGVKGRMTLNSGASFSADGQAGSAGGLGQPGSPGSPGQPGTSGGSINGLPIGNGGDGGAGATGGNGANGGTGGAGAGGTIFLSASLLNGESLASFSAKGGAANNVGRILLAANNALSPLTLPNKEGSQTNLAGERAANSFLSAGSQTPYLPDTRGGPAVSGIVTEASGYEGQAQLDALEASLTKPAELSIVSETSPFSGANGSFNEIFLSNLSNQTFQNLVLGIAGLGTSESITLAPGESWTTLVRGGGTERNITVQWEGLPTQTFSTDGLGVNYAIGVNVPEPSNMVVLGLGGVLTIARRRRNGLGA